MNPELEVYRALKDRDLAAEGLLIAEGPYLVERLLASSLQLHSMVCREDLAQRFHQLAGGRCTVHVLSAAHMSGLVGFRFHRGVLACARRPPARDVGTLLAHPGRALALVCPGLNDSANVGLVIRSAVAFGATCILLGPGCADPYGRRSLRLSMGAALVAPLARYADAAAAERALQAAGYTLVGTANRADALPIMQARPPQRAAVFIGSEGAGLDPILLGRCDLVVRIPIEAGVDSLGASVAAGIALFWMSRAG